MAGAGSNNRPSNRAGERTDARATGGYAWTDHGRTLGNAPWRVWAWPYGAAVLVLTVLWMLLPAGWLWLPLAAVAGFLIARSTWSLMGTER